MKQTLIEKYIEGKATPEEEQHVLKWVNEDPAHEAELKKARKLFDATLWNSTATVELPVYTHIPWLKWWTGIAAIITLVACAASVYFYQQSVALPPVVMQTVIVPPGQRMQLTLVDSTTVWLNAGSSLVFPNVFSRERREVTLNGEGYFSVSKDKKRPFLVRTAGFEVMALGTEFNVMAYDKSGFFEVALQEGIVTVARTGSSVTYRMYPDERLSCIHNKWVTDSITNYDFLLWKEGIISLNDEPMNDVMRKIELYFDVQIVMRNKTLAQRRYTGKFRMKDGVEHILKVFQLHNKFTYTKDDEGNVITIY